MRSMKLDVPKAPGQKRYNAGLAYGACGAGWRGGQQLARLCLAHSKNRTIRGAC